MTRLLLIPAVQKWVTKKVEIVLANKLETTVEIDNVALSFFDKLVFSIYQAIISKPSNKSKYTYY